MNYQSDSQSSNRSEEGDIEPISENAGQNESRTEGEVPSDEPSRQPTDEPRASPISLLSATYSPKSLSSITSLHEYDEMLRKEEPQVKANESEGVELVPDVKVTDQADSESRPHHCLNPLVCVRNIPFIDQDTPEHSVYYPVGENAAQLQLRNAEVAPEIDERYRRSRGIRLTSSSWTNIVEESPTILEESHNIVEESPQNDFSHVPRRARRKVPRRSSRKECVKGWGFFESIFFGIIATTGVIVGALLLGVGQDPDKYLKPSIYPEDELSWYSNMPKQEVNESGSNVPDYLTLDPKTRTALSVVGSLMMSASICVLAFALYSIVLFVLDVMPKSLRCF